MEDMMGGLEYVLVELLLVNGYQRGGLFVGLGYQMLFV
jgi:hypothetical protein